MNIRSFSRRWVLFAFLLTSSGVSVLAEEPKLDRFEGEIRRFEIQDATNSPALGAVLFTGSSSVVKWKGLSNDFAGASVLNRGFGGSTWKELNHYFVRLIPKYRPRAVVVYEGDNDIALGRTVEDCLTDFETFRSLMRQHLPGVPVAILAVKPSGSRLKQQKSQEQLNAEIRKRLANQPDWSLLDVASVVVDSAGKPRPELFEKDQLHLNMDGYAQWVPVVRPWVEKYGERRRPTTN